jgi:hypothetical protein
MAVDVDQSRALRDLNALRGLIEAVVNADAGDELDWIEWKTDVDLGTKDGCFKIAKTILGMTNRLPDVAALTCEGCGYLIIGAEPGNLSGVTTVDPAQWTPRVEKYTNGPESPRWSPMTIPVEGHSVLVITVEPPRDGDPIWSLRTEYGTPSSTVRSGTVYVRKKGRTEPAEANDLDALVSRSRASGALDAALRIELIGANPLPWVDQAVLSGQLRAWVAPHTAAHLQAARAVEAEKNPPVAPGDLLGPQTEIMKKFAEQMAGQALTGFGPVRDTRTLARYEAELEAWAEAVAHDVAEDLPRRWAEAEWSVVQIRITNLSKKYLPGVELQLHIDDPTIICVDNADLPDGIYPPDPPRAFGKAEPDRYTQLLATLPYPGLLPHGVIRPTGPGDWNLTVENDPLTVTFDVGNLRPTRSEHSDEFTLLVNGRPATGLVSARWSVTFEGTDGVKYGTIEIPVDELPTNPKELFDSD